jgi:dephospho-CoA kinase
MLRVGLTGGIACGKSHVLRRMARAGFHVLDLDRVAHEVMAPGGSAYADVVAAFGPSVLAPDRTIDRKALGARVFTDAEARARLNALVHPRVREEEARQVAGMASAEILVVDAALLVEAGVHLRFDRLVVVDCPPGEQLRRLRLRDGLGEDEARARLGAQMPGEEKRQFAHLVLDASGSLEETDRGIDALLEELKALAAAPPPRLALPRRRARSALAGGPREGPRGLRPDTLVADLARAGSLELPALAARLQPPASGPWYQAARGFPSEVWPEGLVVPLVLWALARRGVDPPYLLSVAASVARLTHEDPRDRASACLFALAVQEAAVSGRVPAEEAPWADWSAAAERWGGAAPRDRVRVTVERARAGGLDAADSAVVEPLGETAQSAALARALRGLATGAGSEDAPAELDRQVEALWRGAALGESYPSRDG